MSKADAIAIVRTAVANANCVPEALPIAVLDLEPLELPWAWVVPVQSEEYATSGDEQHLLIGLGPYLVDKFTAEALPTGTGTRLHALERARGYRSWWDIRGPDSILDLRWPLEWSSRRPSDRTTP